MELSNNHNNKYDLSLLNFWFPDDKYHIWWFKSNEQLDNQIYYTYYEQMLTLFKNFSIENYQNLSKQINPNQIIHDIILLDQFSRNINRIVNDLDIRAYTEKACMLSNLWIDKKYYLSEPINYTVFAFLPIRHANNYQLIKNISDNIFNEMIESNNTLLSNEIFKKFKFHTEKSLLANV